MQRKLVLILAAVAACLCPVLAENADKPADRSAESAKRWEDTMAKFKKWDTQNSFPQDAVLFVGSSSIVGWPTRQSFPDLPVINRGFGGSIYSDIVHYADTVIFPYSPKLIVFYSGDNDPYWGKSPEQIAADFKQLKNLVHQKLPQVPIIVMATKISESRISRAEDFKKANAMLKETAQADKLLHYFDSASILLDKQGNPIPEFFRSDKLHLSEEGYKVWTQNIRPLIDELMSAKPAAENRD